MFSDWPWEWEYRFRVRIEVLPSIPQLFSSDSSIAQDIPHHQVFSRICSTCYKHRGIPKYKGKFTLPAHHSLFWVYATGLKLRSPWKCCRPFRTGTHLCLRKFSLSHLKGLMWKYTITEEAPCTGVSNSHVKLPLPFFTNTHNTVHWLFLVIQVQECAPPHQRRKKEAVQ